MRRGGRGGGGCGGDCWSALVGVQGGNGLEHVLQLCSDRTEASSNICAGPARQVLGLLAGCANAFLHLRKHRSLRVHHLGERAQLLCAPRNRC